MDMAKIYGRMYEKMLPITPKLKHWGFSATEIHKPMEPYVAGFEQFSEAAPSYKLPALCWW